MTLAAVFAISLCCSACSSNKIADTSSTAPSAAVTSATSTTAATSTAATTSGKDDAHSTSSEKSAAPAASAPGQLAAEQRGEKVFQKSYCVGCHANGNNTMMPDRPIKGAAFSEKYKDDALLESTIRKGFPDEGMPEFTKDQIKESQMKDLILYIRSFTPTK